MENNRAIPDWGRMVLSDLCVMMRPESEADITAFFNYCVAVVHAYLQISRHVQPPSTNLCAMAIEFPFHYP